MRIRRHCTSDGFQHAVLEFARHVAGIGGAAHQYYVADAQKLVVTALACSLAGTTMRVDIAPGSIAARAYEALQAREAYFCEHGINPAYEACLTRRGLVVSGRDERGEPRIIELPDREFFAVCTSGALATRQPASAGARFRESGVCEGSVTRLQAVRRRLTGPTPGLESACAIRCQTGELCLEDALPGGYA